MGRINDSYVHEREDMRNENDATRSCEPGPGPPPIPIFRVLGIGMWLSVSHLGVPGLHHSLSKVRYLGNSLFGSGRRRVGKGPRSLIMDRDSAREENK